MLDPHAQENLKYFRMLSRKRKAACLILLLEAFSQISWRLFFWVILFAGLWMLAIPEFLGNYARFLAPLAFLAGCIFFIKKDITRFRYPTSAQIDSFLEKSSHIPRGSIGAVEDDLANPQKSITRSLWNSAQKSFVKTFQYIRIGAPRAFITREDPYALRFIAVLMFLCGVLTSGNLWQDRIISGLFPISPQRIVSAGKETNLWITTPDYTQLGQIHIKGEGKLSEAINIPESSTLRLRIHSTLGRFLAPVLTIGSKNVNLTHFGSGLYGVDNVTIETGSNIKVSQGFMTRINYPYTYITDMPPEILIDEAMLEEPEVLSDLNAEDEGENTEETESAKLYDLLERKQIRVPLIVKDDYGVKDLHMRMDIDGMIDHLPLGELYEESRLIMSQPNESFKISPTYDLTWHSWSGLPVTLTFSAEDQKGQTVQLEPISVILPEREFEHPMAKSLIAVRKQLAWNYDDSFMDMARDLETLLSAPDYFQNNLAVFLTIRTAASRLRYTDNMRQPERIKAAKAIIDLLWNAAITIEDGNLSMAMKELRDAQRALENAMRDPNASEDEISKLMENLQQKMQNYFMEMQREMQKMVQDGDNFPQFSPEQFGQMISPDILSKMMQDIESALRDGDTQKAQELMSQMQRMMEMMDPSMMGQMPRDMQMMQEGINELQELIEKQEALLEKTKKQASDLRKNSWKKNLEPLDIPSIEKMLKDFGMSNAPPSRPSQKSEEQPTDNTQVVEPDFDGSKAEQEALRYVLGQLMMDAAEKLPEIPEGMGLAEQEMRGSENMLGAKEPDGAIPHQEKAIEYLKQGQQELSQQLKARMQQMVGIGLSGGQRYDPLGRPYGGEDDPNGQAHGSDVKVPDESQKKRVDEILRELRDRSGDRSRPDDELEYFRRLLRQF